MTKVWGIGFKRLINDFKNRPFKWMGDFL
jgi:hypothetical protein